MNVQLVNEISPVSNLNLNNSQTAAALQCPVAKGRVTVWRSYCVDTSKIFFKKTVFVARDVQTQRTSDTHAS